MASTQPTPIDPKLLAEIRQLQFQTKRLASAGIGGQYRSAFRGRGIEFEEVREYQAGDDVRAIDWKVTARMHQPFIKIYREERELTVVLAVDVSASALSGTRTQLRDSLLAKIAAVLTLIALNNNDKVGLLTFSDKLESYYPPQKARNSVWRILKEILQHQHPAEQAKSKQRSATDLGQLCSFLSSVLKKRSVIFLLSDFLDDGFEKALGTLSKRHDVTSVLVSDPADSKLPKAGIVSVIDPETKESILLDTSSRQFRHLYEQAARERRNALRQIFRKHRVDLLELSTAKPFMRDLQLFFDKRSRHYGQAAGE